jgi:hypothetical protein
LLLALLDFRRFRVCACQRMGICQGCLFHRAWHYNNRSAQRTVESQLSQRMPRYAQRELAGRNRKGAKSFDESWQNLLGAVETKGKELRQAS